MKIYTSTFSLIQNIIQNFVATIDEEYEVKCGTDFCVLPMENIIYWSFLVPEEGRAFYNNFVSRFSFVKDFDIFTLSLLHEIGHLETMDEMIDDTLERNQKLSNEEYFNLWNEQIATDWAGYWIYKNFNEVKIFNTTICKLLQQYYAEILD